MREEKNASTAVEKRRVRIHVHGIVQGVGFRPFIFQLARRHQLAGWVRNQSDGVEMEIAGQGLEIEGFLRDIPVEAPPLARIVGLNVAERPFSPMDDFRILESFREQSRRTLVSPDACTCGDCFRELFDRRNRRHLYPLINCTNCGPRYTIIKDVPYDRDKTTMAGFRMCAACEAEYEDPGNRRFHAQPNGCWDCGPQVWLESAGGKVIARKKKAVRKCVRLLERGAIAAIKGLGGFHLAADAFNEDAVRSLRRRKVREEKPFAVMFPDLDSIRPYCKISGEEEALLQSIERPIVLLERIAEPQGPPPAPSITPRNRFLGAFLPYTPLHCLLFGDGNGTIRALVMTSGNQSDEPIATSNEEARERLKGIADFYLFHDRDIYMRCDDSVTRILNHKPRPLRRARGYVPVPVFLREEVPPVLGVGAELKNTVCLTRNREAFLSAHIGDLENLETLHAFDRTIDHLRRILDIKPELIVHDMHPDYLSTQWANRQNKVPRLSVQHHHAHIASVIAEQNVVGPVLGLALDGTGYGPDGTIWGGEILLVDGHLFKRLGHLRHVPLPGGDKAVKEPWRMALSYMWSIDPGGFEKNFGDLKGPVELRTEDGRLGIPNDRWPLRKVQLLIRAIERRINAPLTSSCGRLFDAVSSLVGLRDSVSYEGQAAIELEQVLDPDDWVYRGHMRKEGDLWTLDTFPLVEEVIRDVGRGIPAGTISARFHNGLIYLLAEAALQASRETGLRRVALSGGVFQNAFLLEHLDMELQARGLEVFSHVEVPSNDACIALGQAYIGAKWLQNAQGRFEVGTCR